MYTHNGGLRLKGTAVLLSVTKVGSDIFLFKLIDICRAAFAFIARPNEQNLSLNNAV